MYRFTGFLVALAVGFLGVGAFAHVMTAVCGRYNEQCGSSLQLWQVLSMAGILLVPQVVAWYVTKE